MGVATFVSVGIGYVAALVAAFHIARYIVAAIVVGDGSLEASERKMVVRMAAAGGFVGLLPALLLGAVVGATYGAAAARSAGGGNAVAVLGVAIGTFVVVVLVMSAAVAIGGYVGRYLARE